MGDLLHLPLPAPGHHCAACGWHLAPAGKINASVCFPLPDGETRLPTAIEIHYRCPCGKMSLMMPMHLTALE
jgi:hypothetical protein